MSASSPSPRLSIQAAQSLNASLTKQVLGRIPDFEAESNAAVKHAAGHEIHQAPPDWAMNALLIALFGTSKFSTSADVTERDVFKLLGYMVGFAETASAELSKPSARHLILEQKAPGLETSRIQILASLAPFIATVKAAEKDVLERGLTGAQTRWFLEGKTEAAKTLIDEEGEMIDDLDARRTICFFIYLYWLQLKHCTSITDLLEFFRSYRLDEVSKKNLEKVCREIGLTFRSSGRPKKMPTAKPERVGIKKVDTRLSSGRDETRQSKNQRGQASPHKRRSS